MSFQSLTNELILEIAEHLDSCRDINAFLRVNHRLYVLLHDELYLDDITRHNSRGLMWATERNRLSLARTFLSLGANANALNMTDSGCSWEQTPLHSAARKGYVRMVRLLLANGGDPRSEDLLTGTPLLEALWADHEQIARILVRHTADLPSFLLMRHIGLSPLHLAARIHKLNFLRWLVQEAGEDINRADELGRTVLHFVTVDDDLPLARTIRAVMFLVNLGANFGCGPDCVPNEREAAARDCFRGISNPLVNAFFDKISCRCGIAMMARLLRDHPKDSP